MHLTNSPSVLLSAKHCKDSISPSRRQRRILKLCQYNVGNWISETCTRVECHRDGWATAPGQTGFCTKVIGKKVSKNVPLILWRIFKGFCGVLFLLSFCFIKSRARLIKWNIPWGCQVSLPCYRAYVDSGVRKPMPSCYSFSGNRHVRNIGEEERFLFVLGIFSFDNISSKKEFWIWSWTRDLEGEAKDDTAAEERKLMIYSGRYTALTLQLSPKHP